MKRFIKFSALGLFVMGGVMAFLAWNWLFKNNMKPLTKLERIVYIESNDSFDSIVSKVSHYVIDPSSFKRVSERMNLKSNIHPGKYKLDSVMNNLSLVRKLRSGRQEQVKVLILPGISREEIAGSVTKNLEMDSLTFKHFLDTTSFFEKNGYSDENWPCMFQANTFFFYWSANGNTILNRMIESKRSFWNASRKAKADQLDLSKIEVEILASIVDGEAIYNAEMPRIAGVYLNRLAKGILLQADPTIRYFALTKDRKRVLLKDLKIEHPYNTYLNPGLPPGPVLLPSNKAIDAVLNAESHDYMYFCAKSDLSGYHAFSKTLAQHNIYGRQYQRAMDKQGILQ